MSDLGEWTCPTCGLTMHPRKCRAHSKRADKKHCGDWAADGAEVCRRHGGAAKQVKAAAAKRKELAIATKAVATYGLPLEVDPFNALLGELHRTAGIVAWLGLLIGELPHDHGDLRHSALKQYGAETGERPSVWIELYQKERAHLAKVATDCLRAGVEERKVRIVEEQGQLIADVIRRIVSGLGRDPADPAVREVVRRELTVIHGEGAA
jgi:hypothetical protein